MPLLLASITGPLVDFATNLIGSLGLAGVLLLTMMTSVVGVPGTEPTMLFAGFNVYEGRLSLVGIIVAGVLGDMIGASIAYAIGYFGRRELVESQGRALHVKSSGLDRAQRWFERWGAPTIFVSRMLPFIRAAFPYAAGVVRMPYWRFAPLATLGSIIWIGALAVLGREVGRQWQTWRHHLEYVDYVGAAVLAGVIIYLIVRWLRGRARNDQADPAADVVPD